MYFEGRANRYAAVVGVCEERNQEWFLAEVPRWGKLGKEHIIVVVVIFLPGLGVQCSIVVLVIL